MGCAHLSEVVPFCISTLYRERYFKMKAVVLHLSLAINLLLLFFTATPSFSADAAARMTPSTQVLKKIKIFHDKSEFGVFMTNSCLPPGVRCESSVDCCGSSMCNDSFCSDPGSNNLPPGAHCQSSSECEGSSMCNNGFCSDPGSNNLPPGAHCESSSECEGSSMCNDGYCSDPGSNNIPPGGHCNSSVECEGSSMCQNGFCS